MRRFSDLVSVARVDAAGSIFGFFLGSRKRKNRVEIRQTEIEQRENLIQPNIRMAKFSKF